jgi:6-phosphogluconolactonase
MDDGMPESRLHIMRAGTGGSLIEVSSIGTGGALACQAGYAPEKRLAAIAHYGSGGITLIRLGLNGEPSLLQYACPDGQAMPEIPRMHCCLFTRMENLLLVCDLGNDCIHRFDVTGKDVPLAYAGPLPLPTGSGPRHMVLSNDEKLAYISCELSNELIVADLRRESVVARLPLKDAGFDGFAAAAAIKWHPDGRMLAVSCRGNDQIKLFLIDDVGIPVPHGAISTAAWPRDIAFSADGRYLLAACEKAGAIQLFDGQDDWKCLDNAQVNIPMPVCLLPAEPL